MRKRALARRTAAEVAADEILEFLGTGRLRDVEEVADAVDLPEDKVEKILDFLARTGFVRKGVQITRLGSNFISRERASRKFRPKDEQGFDTAWVEVLQGFFGE